MNLDFAELFIGVPLHIALLSISKFYANSSYDEAARYLMGDKLSLLDLAWFIYSYRLYISGFPFRKLYPRVSNWFHDLYSRNEFYKEVNDPLILKLIRQYAKISTALSGKSIKALMPK